MKHLKLFLMGLLVAVVGFMPTHLSKTADGHLDRKTRNVAYALEKPVTGDSRALDVIPVTPQDYAHIWLGRYGWSSQWSCLDELITHESGWRVAANNASSAAYGLGQAWPASKMAAYGDDYLTNPSTQLHWMMDYIKNNHGGTPCSNWAFWQTRTPVNGVDKGNWY